MVDCSLEGWYSSGMEVHQKVGPLEKSRERTGSLDPVLVWLKGRERAGALDPVLAWLKGREMAGSLAPLSLAHTNLYQNQS